MMIEELRVAPEVATRLVSLVESDASMHDIAAVIGRDPGLTAQVLRLANSAFFGMRDRLTTVTQAVTLLGLARVQGLALAASLWDKTAAPSLPGREVRQALWLHSAAVGAVARYLAEATGRQGGLAYAAGLLHDIGKLALGFHVGMDYWSLVGAADSEATLVAEEERFGCHHGTVGGWLLQMWGFVGALTMPVSLHHEPVARSGSPDITALVAVADRIVSSFDAGGEIDHDSMAAAYGVVRVSRILTKPRWEAIIRIANAERQAVATLFAG
jgi:HD-like signal output (HDOD) protein